MTDRKAPAYTEVTMVRVSLSLPAAPMERRLYMRKVPTKRQELPNSIWLSPSHVAPTLSNKDQGQHKSNT